MHMNCLSHSSPADDLRVVRELPIKAARDCCFSNGGQYFAVINGNTVHVYCTYTCNSLAVLRGHNGKVGAAGYRPYEAPAAGCAVASTVFPPLG